MREAKGARVHLRLYEGALRKEAEDPCDKNLKILLQETNKPITGATGEVGSGEERGWKRGVCKKRGSEKGRS